MQTRSEARSTPKIDPISIEIQWGRLIAIMDEVDVAVIRSAFSTIVGESRDFAVVLLDRSGRSVAQSQLSSPAFTVTLPMTVRSLLESYPVETLRPGDALITNDPWIGSGHLPDVNIVAPVFHDGSVAGFIGCVAHVADIGGRQDFFDARDVTEEGLLIPPSRLCEAGQENDQLVRIIRANVRVPDMVLGDIRALVGAARIGAARMDDFLHDHGGCAGFDVLVEEILERSEAVVRAALRDMPDGEWSYWLDCDGYREPVTIAVKVTKRGESLSADYSGSSSQVANASINCPFNMTVSDSLYPLKCCLAPHVPNNDGVLRPFSVSAPEGSILRPRRPSPVKSRSKTSFHLHMAIYGALAQAIPERVQAGSGSFWSVILQGRRSADGSDFNVQILPNGGKGATFSQDGLPTIAFPYNGMVTPTEIVENQAPVIIAYKRLACDSGGAGRRRGGLGQHIGFRVIRDEPVTITLRPDKVRHPAIGLDGGLAGAPGFFSRNGESMSVGPVALDLGDVVEVRLPGGGGYGPPRARSVEVVVEDVARGYVSAAAALRDYGVAIDASGAGRRLLVTDAEPSATAISRRGDIR